MTDIRRTTDRTVKINAACVAASVLCLVLMAWLAARGAPNTINPPAAAADQLNACESSTLKILNPEKLNLNLLAYVSDYCYKHELGHNWLTNMAVTSAGYHLQIAENQIMLWMVVVITISGVFLAGLQLRASYLLASSGRLSGGVGEVGELSIARDSISLKSSVTGLLILTVSFAFFLVYVLYVYTIKESEGKAGGSRTAPSTSAILGGSADGSRAVAPNPPQEGVLPQPKGPDPAAGAN